MGSFLAVTAVQETKHKSKAGCSFWLRILLIRRISKVTLRMQPAGQLLLGQHTNQQKRRRCNSASQDRHNRQFKWPRIYEEAVGCLLETFVVDFELLKQGLTYIASIWTQFKTHWAKWLMYCSGIICLAPTVGSLHQCLQSSAGAMLQSHAL